MRSVVAWLAAVVLLASAGVAEAQYFGQNRVQYLSLGPVDSQTAMWLRDADARGKLPTIKKLNDPQFFPYRYGHAFWAYVAGRWGDRAVGKMLRAAGPRGDYEAAIRSITGLTIDDLSAEWHTARSTGRTRRSSNRPRRRRSSRGRPSRRRRAAAS